MVMSDHPTPISRKTHVNDPSPFAVYSSTGENLKNGESFSEKVAQKTGLLVVQGYRLLEYFIGDWGGFLEKQGR
jgi:2,3-bisphosphoglycerate-independent phosphoglycerate mutase